jgi:siderophore synthetase component
VSERLAATLAGELEPGRWERANRELIAKIVTELEFEELLTPVAVGEEADGATEFELAIGERVRIGYRARRRSLGHWRCEPDSLVVELDGVAGPPPDVADLVALAAPALGASAVTAAGLVVEVAQTALADAVQLARGRPVAELLDLDAVELESELRGHPWIVASKGRLGWSAADLAAYAPEAARPLRLGWLAVAAELADVRGLDHHATVREQVGEGDWGRLRERAAAAGLDPDAAVYVPVHPWQWEHRIVALHAADLARERMAWLGGAGGDYRPGQSLRTLTCVGHPERRQLKLPLSILNTSVYRGLPRARTLAAPALTRWLQERCAGDPFLRERGLVLLGEVASVSVPQRAFESIADVPYQHTEMLGAIWREPVGPRLEPGERPLPLAALLHRDPAGGALAAALIERSGLAADDWVSALHEATLPPLMHVLYRFGATFSPHGQNCLLLLRDDVPARLAVKDFVDDMMVSSEALPELADMPADVRAALGDGVEAMLLAQWIQGGLLVCVHRYLAELLEDALGYPEAAFWARAREASQRYHERFEDELGERFDLFDLHAPAFVKLCLNRVRIVERGYDDAAERPLAAARGFVDNPLAPVARPVP